MDIHFLQHGLTQSSSGRKSTQSATLTQSARWPCPYTTQLISGGRDGTIRLWDTETRQLLWMLVVLPDKQTIKFSPEGRMLDGDPAVFEREFRYIVEQPSGAMEIITPKDFQTRTQQRVITQNK